MIRNSLFDRIRFVTMACAILFAGLVLTSCGGDDPMQINPDVDNLPPVAVIEISPATAVPKQLMTLDGSGSSDPEGAPIASYKWQQQGGQPVTLSATDTAQVSFAVPDATTTLVFELVVTDDKASASTPARVEIPVTAVASAQQTAVFVSAGSGNDAVSRNGSQVDPVATIGRALAIAKLKGFASIYVMEGVYQETIAPHSGVAIKGCVTSVDSAGNPSFAADNSKTLLNAPPGVSQAVLIGSAHDVRIECFTITGASVASGSTGVSVDLSQRISLDNLSIKTPGAASASCRDIQATNSSDVIVTDSRFVNSGKCKDAIGVLADNVQGLKIIAEDATNSFTAASNGNEAYLKTIQVQNSAGIEISDVEIKGDGGKLNAATVYTGITMEDAQSAIVSRNIIDVDGGDRPIGIYFRCSDVADDASVEDNVISFAPAQTSATGVRIFCTQPNGAFSILRNSVALLAPDGQAATLRGLDASSSLLPISISFANNEVVMPVSGNDASSKSGVNLSKLGFGSAASFVHNTMLVAGGSGELHALKSDRPDVSFSTINNIFLVYGGGNANNAVYSLPSGCGPAFCAKDIVANLINANVGAKALPLFYFYDLAQFVVLSAANECEQNPQPLPCQAKQIDHRANVLQQNLKPSYFDFGTALIGSPYVSYVKDRGIAGTGISGDIDGKARSDGLPDIGATEY
ncbi:MAG: hypothetical protein WC956_10705 [bacterium]